MKNILRQNARFNVADLPALALSLYRERAEGLVTGLA